MAEIQPRAAIKRLRDDRPPSEDRSGMVRLDMNENTSGAAAAVIRRLRAEIKGKAIGTYPAYEAGRAELAAYFGVAPEELLLTNGIDDAIKLICDTFVDRGDTLLIPSLTFPMYRFFHSIAGGTTEAVPYDSQLRLPLDRILTVLGRHRGRQVRWLALANPNNPTGTMVPKTNLKTILEASRRTLVLVDEAYFDYSGATVLPWIRRYPNLVVARTSSKAHGLAALRLGLLFACRELTTWMRRAQPVFPVNSLALAGALESTRNPEAVQQHVEEVRQNRSRLCECLDSLGVPYGPAAANFVFACFGKRAPEMARRLAEDGILVRHWRGDPWLEPYFRISIGTTSEVRRLIRALEELRNLVNPPEQKSAWRAVMEYSPLATGSGCNRGRRTAK